MFPRLVRAAKLCRELAVEKHVLSGFLPDEAEERFEHFINVKRSRHDPAIGLLQFLIGFVASWSYHAGSVTALESVLYWTCFGSALILVIAPRIPWTQQMYIERRDAIICCVRLACMCGGILFDYKFYKMPSTTARWPSFVINLGVLGSHTMQMFALAVGAPLLLKVHLQLQLVIVAVCACSWRSLTDVLMEVDEARAKIEQLSESFTSAGRLMRLPDKVVHNVAAPENVLFSIWSTLALTLGVLLSSVILSWFEHTSRRTFLERQAATRRRRYALAGSLLLAIAIPVLGAALWVAPFYTLWCLLRDYQGNLQGG